jgi:hypothetical protein
MYIADAVAVLVIFIIVCLLCSKSLFIHKLFRRRTADTEKLQPSSPSALKGKHAWSRLYKFLLILCLLFICTYFIYLRFFGCNDLLDFRCQGALSRETQCVLRCENKLPKMTTHCNEKDVVNYPAEVSFLSLFFKFSLFSSFLSANF